MTYEIKTDGQIGAELRDIAREEIDGIIEALLNLNLSAVDGLTHILRKRLKILRALLSLMRVRLGRKRFQKEDACFREAGRKLGTMRDAQALLETLDRLQWRYFPHIPSTVLQSIRQRFVKDVRQCASALVEPAALATQIVSLQAGSDRTAEWPIGDYGWKEMRGAVDRSYRHCIKLYQRARKNRNAIRMHRWRKQTEYLLTHLRLLRRNCPVLMDDLARDYQVLCDVLGEDHDLVVLGAVLEEQSEIVLHCPNLNTFLRLIELRRGEFQDAAFDLGRRLLSDSPAAFTHKLEKHRAHGCERTRKARRLTLGLNINPTSAGTALHEPCLGGLEAPDHYFGDPFQELVT
jgi:CHAD domain-containing protein